MKELFNFRRFWYYAKVRYSQDKFVFYTPLILLGITLFFIISTFAFSGVKTIGRGEFASFVFYMPFILLCALNAARTFQSFHSRDKGFILLTLPASIEEKFLFGLFNSVVVFGTLFISTFYLCTWITDLYNIQVIRMYNYTASWSLWDLLMMSGADGKLVFPPSAFWPYWQFLCTLSLFYIAGSLFFKKASILKTTLTLLGFYYLATTFASLFFSYPGMELNFVFQVILLQFVIPAYSPVFKLPDFFYWVLVFTWILLMFASYMRLKEKEY